ncbi:MAG: phosphate acetyltransferase [Campylobacterota bacterium]|nr:phosphate acetyltransferase [Campylobacterota bacterium]
MKIKSLYITSNDTLSGKLIIAIGLMQLLKSKFHKVAFFKPIVQSQKDKDNDIDFMLQHFNIEQKYDDAHGFTSSQVETLLSQNKINIIYKTLLQKIKNLEKNHDFVLIEGIDRLAIQAMDEFDLNLKIANHFNSSVISVINCYNRKPAQILDILKIETTQIQKSGANHLMTFTNRVAQDKMELLKQNIDLLDCAVKVFCLPQIDMLNYSTVAQIKKELGLKKLFGTKPDMQRLVYQPKVAAMHLENLLKYIQPNDLLIVPSDRSDVILGILPSIFSHNAPSISAMLLTGALKPNKQIYNVLKGLEKLRIPILSIKDKTYDAAIKVSKIKPKITPKDENKIALIKGLFPKYVDEVFLEKSLQSTQSTVVTPLMFEYSLFQKAKLSKKTIVLPESLDQRILDATQSLLNTHVVDIILVGNKAKIQHKAQILGYDISLATIIDPLNYENTQKFAHILYELRKEKGWTYDKSLEVIQTDLTYFATMLVDQGFAHGMVSGAVNTTADTVRPALQIIKTKKDISIVSSLFFMCLDTKVMVFSDCAVVQDPSAQELCDIALCTASTAKSFGIEPNVAMLSYSTGTSGSGDDVEKIRHATQLVRSKSVDLKVEGPIQYDAATSKVVAKQKLPNSSIAGDANVLIFPDLNTGNNTYKAVRSSANAVAIGPILQGLKKPVNDLSRGCVVRDIVNTVIITAIQANEKECNA